MRALRRAALVAAFFLSALPVALAQPAGWEYPSATSYTASASDNGKCLASDDLANGAASITVQLPAAASISAGWSMCFREAQGRGIIINAPLGAYILAGQKTLTSLTLPSNTNYETAELSFDGTNFQLLGATSATALANGLTGAAGASNWTYLYDTGYSATAADNGHTLSTADTNGPATIVLPSTSLLPTGWRLSVYQDGNAATIETNAVSGGAILTQDGRSLTSYSIPGIPHALIRMQFDGANFRLLGDPGTLTVDVTRYGAAGDGVTDDTAAIDAILANGTGPIRLYFPGTSACYRISAALVAPTVTVNGHPVKRSVYFVGDGPERTQILQTNSAADGIDLSFGASQPGNAGLWSGGGVRGMTIAAGSSCYAPGAVPSTIQSTGIAIDVQNGNNAVHVHNVYWKGFSIGLNLDQTWQGYFDHLWGYGQSVGIQIGCDPAFGQGAGNHFSHILLTNDSFDPGASATALGVKQCSGGDYFGHVELDGFLNGFQAHPGAGQLIEGDSLADVIADTSLGDGMVFDGDDGVIGATRIANSWSGFNNGAGLVIKGVTGNVSGISITGSHFRENGLAGIDDEINADLVVTGSDITGNERGVFTLATAGAGCQAGDILTVQGGTQAAGNSQTTLYVSNVLAGGAVAANGFAVNSAGFYTAAPTGTVSVTGGHCTSEPTFLIADPDQFSPGIAIASGVSDWSFVGNFFGNFATSSLSQASDIAIAAGASTGTWRGNTTSILPPNSGLAYVQNRSTAHINWDEALYASTGGAAQAGGATFYLGPAGAVNGGSAGQGAFVTGGGVLAEMECGTAQTPGAGQTYAFQPFVSGVGPVGTAQSIANGSYNTGDIPQAYTLADGQGLAIVGTYSAGAATSTATCRLGIAH